jgi:hypothetical protein
MPLRGTFQNVPVDVVGLSAKIPPTPFPSRSFLSPSSCGLGHSEPKGVRAFGNAPARLQLAPGWQAEERKCWPGREEPRAHGSGQWCRGCEEPVLDRLSAGLS